MLKTTIKRKEMYILIMLVIFILFFSKGCRCRPGPADDLTDHQIAFSFTEVNFGGDWSVYNTIGVNMFHLAANTNPINNNTGVNLSSPMNYDESYRPSVSIDTTANYILETVTDPAVLSLQTDFNINTTFLYFITDEATLQNATDNNIILNYNLDILPMVDITVTKINDNIVSDAYDYSVNWEMIHQASHNGGNRNSNINIVVMADGYRADQITEYIAYVADAFSNTANFHYRYSSVHIDNDFFARYWDRTNVIRLDTISPHAGIDTESGKDDVQSILDLNSKDKVPDLSRIKEVIRQTRPNGLSISEIDAVVILVNDPHIWAYTWAYGLEISLRRGQPIHPVIIQAPVGNLPTSATFHSYVKTDAIAHELGHAIGRLQDEYISSQYCGRRYRNSFRNIDNDTNFKWEWFINNGYSDSSLIHPVTSPQGGFYCSTGYWRPTESSTMRGSAPNVQFGPVNTYHMTASFKIRTGDVPEQWDNSGFEWDSYPLSTFMGEWPPLDF